MKGEFLSAPIFQVLKNSCFYVASHKTVDCLEQKMEENS